MNSPTSMNTELLTANIENAINNLLPLFEVTEKELAKFERPLVRRVLKPSEYPKHSRYTPAHSSPDNFIYFPLKDLEWHRILYDNFSQATIHHEVGHYIHDQLNFSILGEIHNFLRTGKWAPNFHRLQELVAEYGNFILGLRDYDEISVNAVYSKEKKIYDQYGPEFLPCLARMTLEEVVKKGVIKV